MDLNIYTIIQGPIVTEKSSKLVNTQRKVILDVHPAANKPLIKEALEKLFNVKVKDINIIVRKGKKRYFKRRPSISKTTKRAIITLKDDRSFDILTQSGTSGVMPVEQQPGTNTQSA